MLSLGGVKGDSGKKSSLRSRDCDHNTPLRPRSDRCFGDERLAFKASVISAFFPHFGIKKAGLHIKSVSGAMVFG